MLLNFHLGTQRAKAEAALAERWLRYPPCTTAARHALILHVETAAAAAEAADMLSQAKVTPWGEGALAGETERRRGEVAEKTKVHRSLSSPSSHCLISRAALTGGT